MCHWIAIVYLGAVEFKLSKLGLGMKLDEIENIYV
jgi:hypothetical protein